MSARCGVLQHIMQFLAWTKQCNRRPLMILISPNRWTALITELASAGFPPDVVPAQIAGVPVMADCEAVGIEIVSEGQHRVAS